MISSSFSIAVFLSILAMIGICPPASEHYRADRLDVRPLADVARREVIRLLGDGEGDVGAVLLGDLEGEVGVGQVDPLAGLHRAAVDDPRPHAVPLFRLDPQLDQAAVDQHPLLGLQVLQDLRIDGEVDVVRLGAEDDLLIGLELARLVVDRAEAVAGAHQVQHHRDVTILFGGDLADAAEGLAVLLLGSVGEVQAKQIDPGADEPPQYRLIPAHRPEGRHDLCSSFHGAEYTYL